VQGRWGAAIAASVAIGLGVAARGAWAAPWGWVVANLALAWVPIVLGAAAVRSRRSLLVLGPVWWVFLPNAPYLLTDLVHLAPRPPVPVWFDVSLLGGLGALGLWLGGRSVVDVADAARRWLGPAAGVAVRVLVPPSCGFAMVLGRVGRFHSWHLVTRPGDVAEGVASLVLGPSGPETLAMGGVFAVVVALATLAAAPARPPGHWSVRISSASTM
jgi:uncharacterized membrane protein